MNDLEGKFAIVTGAAQGLGYAIAKAFVHARMRVALLDIKADLLQQVESELRQMGGDCNSVVVDLASAGDTQHKIEALLKQFGTPRVLVHNAAILNILPLQDTSLAEWQRVNNIATQAAFILTKAVWQPMTDSGGGSIIYVSSRSGIEGFEGESAYCCSKHGLEGLMKSLALEGRARNIAVNTITPGNYMRTPMSERNYPPEAKRKWVDPMVLTPAFLLLAQETAAGTTGQRLDAWKLSQPR